MDMRSAEGRAINRGAMMNSRNYPVDATKGLRPRFRIRAGLLWLWTVRHGGSDRDLKVRDADGLFRVDRLRGRRRDDGRWFLRRVPGRRAPAGAPSWAERSDFKDEAGVRFRTYDLAKEYHDRFIAKYGSVTCRDIHMNVFAGFFPAGPGRLHQVRRGRGPRGQVPYCGSRCGKMGG